MLNIQIQVKNYFQNPILISDPKKTFEKDGILNPTAVVKGEKVFLFYEARSSKTKNKDFNSTICLAISKDGINFKKYNKNPVIRERGTKCANPKITKVEGQYFLTYEVKKKNTNKTHLCGALSKNLFKWEKIGEIKPKKNLSIVQDYKYNGKLVGYFNINNGISITFSEDLSPVRNGISNGVKQWHTDTKKRAILFSRKNEKIEIGPSPIIIEQGILLVYNTIKSFKNKTKHYFWNLALFDKENPSKVLWKSKEPIFSSENNKIILGGLVKFQGKWFLYYYSEIDNGISVAIMDFYEEKEEGIVQLRKFADNPILKPREKCLWESKGVFNAAAIYEQGKVYLVYRSVTENDISVLGLAISEDGINISERLDEPIYVPRASFELNPSNRRTYNYLSGWGHSGCEDPRMVKIEDRIYMTYTAFDGGNPPGVALTSIKCDDFLNRKWENWELPVLISRPGELHKNWVIFPEKIDNKYAILHSISPEILIEYFDELKFNNGKYIKSFYDGNCLNSHWESCTRGVGPPPIKTDKGWLILYHAIEDRDPGKYKLGAMLLDLKNPYQIIARSKRPVLEPEMNLNIGKPGVVYSCGAVVIKDKLFVYYGQNDCVLGVATANLDEFLEKLLT
ncbi:hypothetical protein M1N50_00260 [Dehalococcoidia bacterium]|nr:hypothetical protein [Dehalococcoidia bacterium]